MIRDRVTNLLYGALQGRDTICVCVTCPCGDRPMCQHFHHHHQRSDQTLYYHEKAVSGPKQRKEKNAQNWQLKAPEHWDIPSHIITHHASRITHPHHNLLAFVVLSCFVVLL
ncbi:hypothetical protein B0F90DRAFT_1789983 [Multifurca ochricompacta]|uniref:Uncharacterized protein n=1 Tax=Multifurca ochricompacta TaxID=376703 RepID=A0AAD4LTV4_9AGAM|nr:hypothetical protein B0F90DRAFT_1789983 [Multifurca ochricompacta]